MTKLLKPQDRTRMVELGEGARRLRVMRRDLGLGRELLEKKEEVVVGRMF